MSITKNKKYFDKVASKSDGDYTKGYINSKYSIIVRLFQSYIKYIVLLEIKKTAEKNKKQKLIDIGCADGVFSRKLKVFGDVVGIDISKNMISLAKEKDKDSKYFVMDMHKIKFDNNSFDYALCINSLHHTKAYNAVISEMCRISKKYIFIEIKNKNSPFSYIRKKTQKNLNLNLIEVKPNLIINTFKERNFELIKSKGTIPFINPSYLLFFKKK